MYLMSNRITTELKKKKWCKMTVHVFPPNKLNAVCMFALKLHSFML